MMGPTSNPEQATKAAALMVFKELSDLELGSLNSAITAGWPTKGVNGHEKIAHLLTVDGGTKFHSLVREAFDLAVARRFPG
jgi:hypothetical protein